MRVRATVLVLALLGCHTQSSPQLALQTFTLEELVPLRPEFYPDRLSVQWISDTEFIFNDPSLGIRKYDAVADIFTKILGTDELFNLNSYSVSSFSKDGNYLLLIANRKKVYRYSSLATYSVYDLKKKSIVSIADGPLQVVLWGNGRSLAYVKNNNVYYMPDASKPDIITLTSDGVPGEVYFGATDWIYEEEIFNSAEALWFSPSGSYLAVASFNDTNVESAIYPEYGNPTDITDQYPELVKFKYPKAGRANPVVGLQVFKVDDPTSDAWNIPAPPEVGVDHILGRVSWASDKNLVVLWLNRRQNVGILVNCDLTQDKCTLVKQRKEPNGWIDINDLFFDKTGTAMIEIEPQFFGNKRFLHVARSDLNGHVKDLTPTNSTVTEILGWVPENDTVYYILAPINAPWLRQLWVSTGGVQRCISCKERSCHHVSAAFSPGSSYGIVACSGSFSPPKTFLFKSKDESFSLIKDNMKLSQKLSQYRLPLSLYNMISLGNDVLANIKLLLPPSMEKDKKYPMVVRVYAGPGTSRVHDNYDLEFYNAYLSVNRSFIIASIDVRGSGVMGVEAMHAVNNALGTVEITDTLATIRALVTIYPFIDPMKVGVWGWSYGGYATAMMLAQDDQHVITCGVSVAPVTSWLYYDTIYTERYMGTPQANPLGYQRSDLTAMAEKLRGRRFLLVHGTGDDNVHYQHSLQLAKQLQHADIAFEQMSYTDEDHSLKGVSRHFYHTLDHFWTECFRS